MFSLQHWSRTFSRDSAVPPAIRQITIDDANKKLQGSGPDDAVDDSTWTIELILLYSESPLQEHTTTSSILSLIGTFEDSRWHIVTLSDTVEFNSYLPDWQVGNSDKCFASRRAYNISDNTFGIYWMWNSLKQLTTGFMYGQSGEGYRQMHFILNSLTRHNHFDPNPHALSLFTLQAEVTEMHHWVASQGRALSEAHVYTGHHGYANVDRRLDMKSLDLSKLSRDVCGLAVNVSTSTLCLQRIVKLADFVMEDCKSLHSEIRAIPFQDQGLVEALISSNVLIEAEVPFWRRRAESLRDEADCWKHKASILLQTVFTLATQRDQDISIRVAQDSRTLAQKATRDSTSMKAIAAVTMCFLPGTFVASLFDMSMFDWNAPPGEAVSKNFWLYWAVTLPLTFAVIGIWLGWTNREKLPGLPLLKLPSKDREKPEQNQVF